MKRKDLQMIRSSALGLLNAEHTDLVKHINELLSDGRNWYEIQEIDALLECLNLIESGVAILRRMFENTTKEERRMEEIHDTLHDGCIFKINGQRCRIKSVEGFEDDEYIVNLEPTE